MQIGDIKIENPVFLAPMAGITDLPYRCLIKEQGGCGLVYTEMVSAKGLVYGNQKTKELLTIDDKERPVALQLFGNQPEVLAEAAEIVVEEVDPELIDLNVGCPAPKIVNSGYGSALMKDPQLLGRIVAAMNQAVPTPITVKIRAGWDRENLNAVQVAKIVESNGAAALAVHGRTREEFYRGQADWEIIKKVKDAIGIPVIGNGDIFSPQDAQEMIEETNCDAIMIARGAKGNPWIFNRVSKYLNSGELVAPPKPEMKIETAINHLKKLVEYKGEYVGVREMRKHTAWYIKGLRNCTAIKDRANQAEDLDEMIAILVEYKAQFN